MMRPITMLSLAALAALATTAGAEAASFASRATPQYLASVPPPANLNCPTCGVTSQSPTQLRPGGAVMLNPQPLPPRYLQLRR